MQLSQGLTVLFSIAQTDQIRPGHYTVQHSLKRLDKVSVWFYCWLHRGAVSLENTCAVAIFSLNLPREAAVNIFIWCTSLMDTLSIWTGLWSPICFGSNLFSLLCVEPAPIHEHVDLVKILLQILVVLQQIEDGCIIRELYNKAMRGQADTTVST